MIIKAKKVKTTVVMTNSCSLQRDSKTRNGQRQEVEYVGWCQQSSWFDRAAWAPFQSKAGSRLQTHQQHVPSKKQRNSYQDQDSNIMRSDNFLRSTTLTYWRRKKGLISGGDEAVCGRSSWLAATGSSSPCWLFQNSSSDFNTWRQYSIAPRLSKAVAVAFEISEDDWKIKKKEDAATGINDSASKILHS